MDSSHHGKRLNLYLKSEGISPDALAKKLKVSRGSIFGWYKHPQLPEDIIEKLEKRGDIPRNIFEERAQSQSEVSDKDKLIQALERENALLNKLLSEKERNADLERRVFDIENDIRKLFSDSSQFQQAIRYINAPLDKLSVCIADAAGKIQYINDEFTKQTGFSFDEVKGKKPGDILQGKNTTKDSVKRIRDAIRGRQYFEGEITNYTKSGEEIICRLILSPIQDKSGKLERFISLAVFSKVNVLKYN